MELYSSRKNLVQVSKLYYMAGMSQEEIAHTMGISRSKVSRMLTLAREMKVVQFNVCEYPDLRAELEHKLSAHFGLKTVRVVPSASTIAESKHNVGKAAAALLRSRLRDHMRIGLEWGSTCDALVESYTENPPVQDVEIIQITGGMHISDAIMDGREQVKHLAHKIGCGCQLLQYPMMVHNSELARMILENECPDYFARMSGLDLAFVGLGSSLPEESSTYLGGYITLEQARQLVEQGFAADVCGHRLTQDGQPAQTMLEGKLITLSLEQLHRLPCVVGIAAGDHKKESIIAASKGGYISGLVCDEVAAIAVAGSEHLI